MAENDHRFVLYEECFDEKHHYDNLSWTIGGVLLVFVGAVLAYIPQIKPTLPANQSFGVVDLVSGLPDTLFSRTYLSTVVPRAILAAFACLLIALWHRIYERNRIWAEVANQKIRDFEREFRTEGIGIRFMKENANICTKGQIILRNIEENGTTCQGYTDKEVPEKVRVRSMHYIIPVFLKLIYALFILACLVP